MQSSTQICDLGTAGGGSEHEIRYSRGQQIHCPVHHKHRDQRRVATRGAATLKHVLRTPTYPMPLPPLYSRRDPPRHEVEPTAPRHGPAPSPTHAWGITPAARNTGPTHHHTPLLNGGAGRGQRPRRWPHPHEDPPRPSLRTHTRIPQHRPRHWTVPPLSSEAAVDAPHLMSPSPASQERVPGPRSL